MKRNRLKGSVLAAALCLAATASEAAGLGRITVLSPLGQPLRAEIDITASRDELASISARLASPEAFKQVGIEYAPGISGIRFILDKRKDGQPFLRMVTDRPVNEPFLDVLVELTWSSGRMVREYTLLLDPPEALSKAAPVPVAAPEAPALPAPTAAPDAPPRAVALTKSAEPAVQPAPTEKADAVSDTYLVRSGDTLSKIASITKPEGVGLEQMLVALFQSNQNAFIGANMNRMRAGKILSIPPAEEVVSIAPSDAHRIVVTQARDFNAYRSRLAASVAAAPAAREEGARQQDEGKIGARIAEKPAIEEAPKDKLEVSRTEAVKDSKAVQGRISAVEEDLIARDRALREASSRVAELERNLSDLKKLAEMKSQAGAQLQQQAQEAKPAATEQPPAKSATAEQPPAAKPAEAPVAKAGEEAKPAKPAVPAPQPEAAKPAQPVEAVADKPVKKPVVVAPAAPAEESSFIAENPTLVYGGGGIVALLLGYLGFSAWRQRRGSGGAEGQLPPSRLTEGELAANSVFGSTGGQAVDTSASIQTDFSQASLSAIDADEGVDPVAEADVYMAYGRDAQAEEILVDALKIDPARTAIHLKLLEIHSGHKNVAQFQKVATGLYEQTGGIGADWEKAAAMGRALEPGNSLYSGGPKVAEAPPVVAAPVPPAPAPAPADEWREPETLPGQLPQEQVATGQASQAAPATLDFDLDLGLPSAEKIESLEVAAKSAVAPEAATLDFDLDLGEPVIEAMPAVEPLDIDLTLPEVPPVEAPPEKKAATAAAAMEAAVEAVPATGLDFEFDIEAPTPVAAKAAPAAAPVIDFSGIDLELDTPPTQVVEAAPPPVAVEADNPDVATKLELAQAYEEMGDREGARELLQEVLGEGSRRQQELARNKLAALDA